MARAPSREKAKDPHSLVIIPAQIDSSGKKIENGQWICGGILTGFTHLMMVSKRELKTIPKLD
jgi:hypothetical protein